MKADYLNKTRVLSIIRETQSQKYWMQSLAFKMFWNYRKHGEGFITLKMVWDDLKYMIENIDVPEPSFEKRVNDYCQDLQDRKLMLQF